MWKPEHRRAADRRGLRYPSDLTDGEWALVARRIPPAKRGGRRRLPPKSTARYYFMLWEWDGTLERIHQALHVATREREGHEAAPTAAIIDSQSAKAAQKGAPRSTRRVSMRARRLRAANGIFSSTRSVCC
jgi:transposase